MIRLTRSHLQPVGLDIGSDSIKMMQLEAIGPSSGRAAVVSSSAFPSVGSQTLSVYAAARESLPAAARERSELRIAAAGDMIRQMFRHGRFSGRNAVVSLPREMLHVKNLRMPLIPPQELLAAVRFEARNIFPFDTDKCHMQILPAGEVRQGIDVRQEIIVLAARNEDVDAFVEQMHRFGVIVESIDIESAAIYRGQERFIRRREDEQDVHVLVDVGFARSNVVIGRGRDISFIKPIEIGSRRFHEDVSRKLGITMEEARGLRRRLIDAAPGPGSPDLLKKDPVRQAVFDAARSTMEELGREIALCLRYYSVTFRGQRPQKVKLIGGEAADPLLLGVLNASLGIPVEAGRPLFSVDTSRMDSSDRIGFGSEWATAFGLALKMTKGQFAPRDGKPRDPAVTTAAPAPVAAEVIDIAKAVEVGSAVRTNPQTQPVKEEIHA
jgi:type IV pilus assembly protein PilM